MLEEFKGEYNEALLDTDRDRALAAIDRAVASGVSPEDVVFKIVVPAIEEMVNSLGGNLDANLAQHFMTSQISAEVTEAMVARFSAEPVMVGRVVIGTAEGDLHSLGKRIVMGCLKALMIETHDLGVNVTPERFVEAAMTREAQVIGISAMMAHTARGENGCQKVRQLLRDRGLENRIKIIVGGAPYRFDSGLYRTVGADAWAEGGISAGRTISALIKGV